MNESAANRREFLATAAALVGGSWASMNLPVLAALAASARTAAAEQAPFTTLTSAEARTMEAFAAQIVPTDATGPGAREAGAIWFIDRALGTQFAELKDPIKAGIADLDGRAKKRRTGVASFADLPVSEQIKVMRQVEDTPFFGMGRILTVIGVFGDPRHGGNRDHVGERILGIEHKPAYQPPFGWYDAEEARRST